MLGKQVSREKFEECRIQLLKKKEVGKYCTKNSGRRPTNLFAKSPEAPRTEEKIISP